MMILPLQYDTLLDVLAPLGSGAPAQPVPLAREVPSWRGGRLGAASCEDSCAHPTCDDDCGVRPKVTAP
jgi:hypothetical protein